MDAFPYGCGAATVEMGYDAVWLTYPPVWRYEDSRNMYDTGGKRYQITFDGRGNLGTPMDTGSLIKGPDDWRA